MKSLNNNIRIVNNGPSAVRSVAAGGLAALRSNRTIVSLSDGRTPGVVAGSGIYGRQRPAYYRPLFSKLFDFRRAARAYKDFIALTFLGSIYAQVGFVVEGVV